MLLSLLLGNVYDDGADDDSDNDDDNNRMMTISNKSEPTCQLGPTWSHEIRRMSLMRVIEGRTRCVKKNIFFFQ